VANSEHVTTNTARPIPTFAQQNRQQSLELDTRQISRYWNYGGGSMPFLMALIGLVLGGALALLTVVLAMWRGRRAGARMASTPSAESPVTLG